MRTAATAMLLVLSACGGQPSQRVGPEARSEDLAVAEVTALVNTIIDDARKANIEGLQSAHLQSSRFSKFGPRSFHRQDLASTDSSEAAFFSSITDYQLTPNDLKIDIFDDVAIVTYHPAVSFRRDGALIEVQGRQTFVLVDTDEGWKVAHEHGTVLLQ